MNLERRDSLLGAEARGPVDFLRSPLAIRTRTEEVLQAGLAGDLAHFSVDMGRMPALIERVVKLTREAYPALDFPHHGRFGHLRVGDVDRLGWLEEGLGDASEEEKARARIDLVVTSVLLDAGAGMAWRYREERTGLEMGRSEGLAMASYAMFEDGLFSANDDAPYRADADALDALDVSALAGGFQVTSQNQMHGLEGRCELLARLGSAMRASPQVFGADNPRVGGLYDYLRGRSQDGVLAARRILTAVLEGLGPIWPGRIELDGVNLGDVWRHPAAGGGGASAGLVPFHKLSQWLVYSMVEPLEMSGLRVTGLDELTGLAEYRNGGLLVDDGVLVLKDASASERAHPVGSELVVEWRALTIALLEHIATGMRDAFGKTAEELPMSKVLQGGTWMAGRQAAQEKRADGAPPIRIQSDGTVF